MDRVWTFVRFCLLAGALAMLLAAAWPAARCAAQPVQGSVFTNSAWLSLHGLRISEVSNAVTIAFRTPSRLELLRHAPGSTTAERLSVARGEYSTSGSAGGPFAPQPLPLRADGVPFDLNEPIPLVVSDLFLEGDAIFIRLTDYDQNLQPTEIESVLVTLTSSSGDQEVIRLFETGPDSGVFLGYSQSRSIQSTQGDGYLAIDKNSTVSARYRDRSDLTDVSTSAGLFDPVGIVFNSLTGQPVNGVVVTIYRLENGLRTEAEIFGDDGVSRYPSTVVSGTSATDTGGTVYNFPQGGYRFPLMALGTYLIEVTPPPGFNAPSLVRTVDLQTLSGAPFAIHESGSRGEPFLLDPVPIMRLDIPIDPLAGMLWVVKNSGKATAAVGDFVPYRVSVQNTSGGISRQTVLRDRLPAGFRYQAGSSRINNLPAADPAISADGRELTYSLGDLLPGQSHTLTYVAAVGPRTRPGDAINQAVASEQGGAVSNVAQATVKIREELLRSRAWIMGQVVEGACGDASAQRGVPGVRIYLEDGTFVITDRDGRYHFEGVRAGSHVVQIDQDSLAPQYDIVGCEENSRFAGQSFSQFVDVQGGSLWRADFQIALKPRPQGDVALHLETSTVERTGHFRLSVQNGAIPLDNLRLNVHLPSGAIYQKGSSRQGETMLADPRMADEQLHYSLGHLDKDQSLEIYFQVALDGDQAMELPVRALLTFDSPTQRDQTLPPAEIVLLRTVKERRETLTKLIHQPRFAILDTNLAKTDRELLAGMAETLRQIHNLHLTVVGHSDNYPVPAHQRHLFRDNFALSTARAQNVAQYLTGLLDLTDDRITLESLGASAPIADNGSENGRARNRRVDILAAGDTIHREVQLQPLHGNSSRQTAQTEGLRPGEKALVTRREGEQADADPATDGILAPRAGALLTHATNAVQISIDSRLKPLLLVDGKEIPAERIGFTMADRKTRKTLYSYIGVDFGDAGPRQLQLKGIDPFGNVRFEETITVVRTGKIVTLQQVENGANIADGKTPVRMRLSLLDQAGHPVRGNISLELDSATLTPYDKDQDKLELDPGKKKPSRHVSVDPQGWVTFAPVSVSGPHRAILRHGDLALEVETYVRPHLRDWILVGLAEGTVGYQSLSGNMEGLSGAEAAEGLYQDGRLAFYAKGKVKGEWLLTMAYDSDKPREDSRLFGTIDPNAYYPLYGDATVQGYDAASKEKLYLRLERDQFYALFGDFNTGLTVTELSRYSRSLTGLKSQWQGQYFDLNVFASDTDQAFVKDELRGDGTSGLYRLSKRNIVVNSEKIVIEVRDRFQSELVLEARELWRHSDYIIDYQDGTIFFKEPVMSQNRDFNPVWIVIDYELVDKAQTSLAYGGRGALRLPAQGVEVGGTLVREEANEGRLTGLDATWKIGPGTELRTEAAKSTGQEAGVTEEGSAWLAELRHLSEQLSGRLYYREVEQGFGLGQQRASEAGTRKYGSEGQWRFLPRYSLGAQLYRQHNLETGADRELLQSSLQYEDKVYRATLGWRHVTDTLADGQVNRSMQGMLGGSWKATSKLSLRLNHEQALADRNDSSDFPTRTLVGGDYQLSRAVALFAEQEWTRSDQNKTEGTRAGLKSTPWSGGQLHSSVEQRLTENSSRAFANFGLKQTWQATPEWGLDGTLDRSQTLRESGTSNTITNAPAAFGDSDDFTAITLGATYKREKWTWANRVELRDGEQENKYGAFTSIMGEVKEGLGLSARTQLFRTDGRQSRKTNGDVRLGLVHRPLFSRWIVLDRLDFIFDHQTGGAFDLDSWRIINNFHANYKPNRRTQLSLQYGAKYVEETIDGQSYDAVIDLIGVEGRYDFTPKWDIGLRTSALHSWNSGALDYLVGPSVGYNVVKNAWISVGYNLLGFHDPDFSKADFTAQGPYLKMRIKFDQDSVREALKWL